MYGLSAIKTTVDEDKDFNSKSIEISFIDHKNPLQYLNEQQKQEYIDKLQDVFLYFPDSNLISLILVNKWKLSDV